MKAFFELAFLAFETAAVLVLILGTVYWMVNSVRQLIQGIEPLKVFRAFRVGFGKTLLLALDVMLAADIILTAVLDLSFESLGALGLLVLIRTFLHFVLEIEVTGRLPWQHNREPNDA